MRKENISVTSSPTVDLQTAGNNSIGIPSQAGGFIPSEELTQVSHLERAGNLNTLISCRNMYHVKFKFEIKLFNIWMTEKCRILCIVSVTKRVNFK